jgi:hypothetical protein
VKKQMYDNSEVPKPIYGLENLNYEDMRFLAEKCYESIYRKMREWKNDPEQVIIIMRTSRFRVAKQIFPDLLKESAMRYALETIFEEMKDELEFDFKTYLRSLQDSSRKIELGQTRIRNIKLLTELLEQKDKL